LEHGKLLIYVLSVQRFPLLEVRDKSLQTDWHILADLGESSVNNCFEIKVVQLQLAQLHLHIRCATNRRDEVAFR
jgi:hypothetical protein